MQFYEKILSAVGKILMYSVALALAIMIGVSFTEVIRRYLFGLSFPWGDELIRYLIIYVGFAGGAAAFRNNSLVSLDLFTKLFNEKTRVIIALVCNTIILVFLIFLFRYSINAILSSSIRMQKGIGLRISMSIPFASLPIGFFFMIVFGVDNYRGLIRRLKGGLTER